MKKNRLLSILLITLVFLLNEGQWKVLAQDIHFSQFNMAPLSLNPALAGFYDGNHRVFLNYKNQWQGMSSSGAVYKTSMCSYDTRLLTKKIKGGYLGAGFTAFKDVAGDLKLGTTQLNISVSGVVNLNSKQVLSGGIQGGIVQRSISTSAMQWDAQYDQTTGNYNSALPSYDVSSIPTTIYGDFSGGLAWSYSTVKAASNYGNKDMKVTLGISAFHLNRPNEKFQIYNTSAVDNLSSKFTLHGSGQVPIASSKYQLVPSFILLKQGPHLELDMGTMVRWLIQGQSRYTGNIQGMALAMGVQYRAKDAIIPMVLYEYSDYALGVSYDVNTSSLRQGTRGRGGVEISVRYIKPIGISSTRVKD